MVSYVNGPCDAAATGDVFYITRKRRYVQQVSGFSDEL